MATSTGRLRPAASPAASLMAAVLCLSLVPAQAGIGRKRCLTGSAAVPALSRRSRLTGRVTYTEFAAVVPPASSNYLAVQMAGACHLSALLALPYLED